MANKRRRPRPEEIGRAREGYVSLLRSNRQFRNLCFAVTVSGLGDWFNWLATVLVLSRPGAGYGALAAVVIIHTSLPILLTPIAGVLADRLDRRRLLVFCDTVRIIVVLGLMLAAHLSAMWLLWVLIVLQYGLAALHMPAAEALVPRLVTDPVSLKTANALFTTMFTGASAAGAMLGGAVVAAAGADVAYAIDAATFVVSALLTLRIVVPADTEIAEASGGPPASTQGMWTHLQNEPRLGAAFLAIAGVGVPAGLLWLMIMVLGQKVISVGSDGAVTIGALNAASWIGGMLGSAFFNSWFAGTDDSDQIRSCIKLCAIRGMALLGIALLPVIVPYVGVSLGVVAAFLIVTLFSTPGGAMWVAGVNFAQAYAPDRLRGRAFAIMNGLWTGGQALSMFVATQAESHGASISSICVGMAGVVGLLMLGWWYYLVKFRVWAVRARSAEATNIKASA